MLRVFGAFLIFFCGSILSASAEGKYPIANMVRDIVEAPADRLDFARAKVMLDKLVDPSIDVDGTLAEIDRMAGVIERMIATIPESEQGKSIERLKALKAFVYRPGHWNDERPFEYDLDDPYGQKFENRLLSSYLKTRKGNCISMPILFLALGERLGLDISLSTAPLHVLVKYTDDQTNETYNLEATSGAGFTRDVWYQKKLPMSDAAIQNGVYLKQLTRKETLAVMAGIVVEYLIANARYEEAIAVADVLIGAFPANGYIMAKKGTAYYHMLNNEFISKYPDESDIPSDELERAKFLFQQNHLSFSQAEALGWRHSTLQ